MSTFMAQFTPHIYKNWNTTHVPLYDVIKCIHVLYMYLRNGNAIWCATFKPQVWTNEDGSDSWLFCLEAFAMDDRWSGFIVFLFRDPHLQWSNIIYPKRKEVKAGMIAQQT
uniref:Retrotransposon protein n=1 Tax=Ascaris lumbricoides TaxID=6252 RepID=A0A0M3IC44_ASCLU